MVRLLDIAKIEEDTEEARRWAEDLFDDIPTLEKYLQLRDTFSGADWPSRREKLINDLREKSRNSMIRHSDLLAQIFIAEDDDERLLKWLQIHSDKIDFVDRYSGLLKETRPAELLDLYARGIRRHAELTGRKQYNQLAMYLHTMKEIEEGEEAVAGLVRDFQVQYRNRPAMMEVLKYHFEAF